MLFRFTFWPKECTYFLHCHDEDSQNILINLIVLLSIYFLITRQYLITFLYSNHIPTLLHYFSCVSQVFTKYRLSFKLSKPDILLSRIEYAGHNFTAGGNCPAQSKFQLIKKEASSATRLSLFSFIALFSFYNN